MERRTGRLPSLTGGPGARQPAGDASAQTREGPLPAGAPRRKDAGVPRKPVWTRGRRRWRGPGSQPRLFLHQRPECRGSSSPGRSLRFLGGEARAGSSPALLPRPRPRTSVPQREDGHPAADDGKPPGAPGPCPSTPKEALAFRPAGKLTKEPATAAPVAPGQLPPDPQHPPVETWLCPRAARWTFTRTPT